MEKKIYIAPQIEVMQLGSDVIMEAFHEASMPSDPFSNNAPRRHDDKAPLF